MKKLFEKHFERTWLIIFLIMFVLIMIPFPFFYSETYIPAFGGFHSIYSDGLFTLPLHLC